MDNENPHAWQTMPWVRRPDFAHGRDEISAMTIMPAKIKLENGGDTLAIEWQDGHSSVFAYDPLRNRCPCSSCTGAEGGTPQTSTGTLPMFKKAVRPLRAEVVGRYALQIFWSDGHSTGIYGFSYLRELCACGECAARHPRAASDKREDRGRG